MEEVGDSGSWNIVGITHKVTWSRLLEKTIKDYIYEYFLINDYMQVCISPDDDLIVRNYTYIYIDSLIVNFVIPSILVVCKGWKKLYQFVKPHSNLE